MRTLIILTALVLSTSAFSKETIQCAAFGKPTKLRPVNAVAIKLAAALKVKTCEAQSFITYGSRNFNFKEVEATDAMIKKYNDAQYKILKKKLKGKTSKKLW